jgi:hypothetical protein
MNCGICQTWKQFQEDLLSIQLEQLGIFLKIKVFKAKLLTSDALETIIKERHLRNLYKKME